MDCLFCSIIEGKIPSEKVYEDDVCLVFKDIAPQAPHHVLIIPKRHIESVCGVNAENARMVAHIFEVIAKLSSELPQGFRVITNSGEHGRQSVKHLHFHILGGRPLTIEMG